MEIFILLVVILIGTAVIGASVFMISTIIDLFKDLVSKFRR